MSPEEQAYRNVKNEARAELHTLLGQIKRRAANLETGVAGRDYFGESDMDSLAMLVTAAMKAYRAAGKVVMAQNLGFMVPPEK